MRSRKTILISTLDIEEASVLGDYIVILQAGKVKCYGTPMFLKRYFGNLTSLAYVLYESERDQGWLSQKFLNLLLFLFDILKKQLSLINRYAF